MVRKEFYVSGMDPRTGERKAKPDLLKYRAEQIDPCCKSEYQDQIRKLLENLDTLYNYLYKGELRDINL